MSGMARRCLVAVMIATACACLFSACASSNLGEGSELEFSTAVSSEALMPDADEASSESMDSSSSEEPAAILEEPDEATLYALLSEDFAASLIDQAKTDADAAWIAAHPGEYGIYGPVAQTKLLEIAARDPEAVPYVRDFLDSYPADGPDYDAPALDDSSPSSDIPETGVPHLYQWDQRWGYLPYGGFCMGTSACGPTSLTMVYRALTGDESISPYDMAQKAYEWGCVSESGTGAELLTIACEPLGLQCWEIPATADDIVAALRDGHPLIDNVGIGYFSTAGHYFVLAGISDDGRVILNDPFSITRSSQLWDPELIASESRVIYAYALA